MDNNIDNQRNEEKILQPEDYREPNCVLCGDPYGAAPKVKTVPLQRIIEKVDEFQTRQDASGAERMLKYWLSEAELGGDLKGQLGIRNEFIGLYRKNGRKEDAFESIQEAMRLLDELDFHGSISSGTTYTNSATAYYTFGSYEKALPLFEKALEVYEKSGKTSFSLLGGLYNNMGLTLTALRQFERAGSMYGKALSVMEQVPGSEPEQAITYLNMADCISAEKGTEEAEEEIFAFLDKAEALLDQSWESAKHGSSQEKGYCAFVFDSCAPTFSYYGYFIASEELRQRAQELRSSAVS